MPSFSSPRLILAPSPNEEVLANKDDAIVEKGSDALESKETKDDERAKVLLMGLLTKIGRKNMRNREKGKMKERREPRWDSGGISAIEIII
jgi:hypothetical protein